MSTAGRVVNSYDRRRTVSYDRISRIVEWAYRMGFERQDCFANLTMGWWRAYNVRKAENGKSYNRGAMGIQIEWRTHGDGHTTMTVHTWRCDGFRPLGAS